MRTIGLCWIDRPAHGAQLRWSKTPRVGSGRGNIWKHIADRRRRGAPLCARKHGSLARGRDLRACGWSILLGLVAPRRRESVDAMTLKFDQAIFHNGNFVLGPLDLQFRAAAVTVVIGPNGSGKSTFLRAAAGLLSAHSGGARLQLEQPRSAHAQLEHPQLEHPQFEHSNSARVTMPCSDQDLARMAPAQRARLLSFVPQRPESVAGFSVRTSVELGRVAMRADAPRVQLAMQRTGIDALADEPVGHLSEGQRHRVAFARALAQRTADTQLLIVDEPTSALDPSWTRALANELRHCASEGLAVIVATHDFAFAGAVADDIVALSQGKIAATGHACDVLVPHILQPIFTIPFRMVEHLAARPLCLPLWSDDTQPM